MRDIPANGRLLVISTYTIRDIYFAVGPEESYKGFLRLALAMACFRGGPRVGTGSQLLAETAYDVVLLRKPALDPCNDPSLAPKHLFAQGLRCTLDAKANYGWICTMISHYENNVGYPHLRPRHACLDPYKKHPLLIIPNRTSTALHRAQGLPGRGYADA